MTSNPLTESSAISNTSEEFVRIEKAQALTQKNIPLFGYKFDKTHNASDIVDRYANLKTDEVSPDIIKISGRMMAKRGHGKAFFGNLQDETGTIQFYANIEALGEEQYDNLLSLDTGDILGLTGIPFRTKRGELSIKLQAYELLTKSFKPLPEKYHGLQDKELRYRQRYVDLIVNSEVRDTFKMRSKIMHHLRLFLHEKGFMEVETPVLHAIYGGASARPFKTFHNTLDQELYMRIALELHLKRLLVGGFEKIFEIGRVFRNEGVSFKHNPEYTLLELYQAYVDYETIMDLTEEILRTLIHSLCGTDTLVYQEQTISFKEPFKRQTLKDAIQEHAGVDADAPIEVLWKKAAQLGLDISSKPERGHVINYIYDKSVESKLIQPTFITDYPWETSPLAKRKASNPALVERFELIINGMEIANAFSELNDPFDQITRFEEQQKAREAGDDEAHQMDEDFVNALKHGMPPAGGLGIGIDRIVMLMTNSASIRDVIFFPHMRTQQNG